MSLLSGILASGDDLVEGPSDDVVEFVAEEENVDVIAEPVPAREVLPRWYKRLEAHTGDGHPDTTVKRCMPFLDAMSLGWIIPTPGEVHFTSNAQTGRLDYKWQFPRPLMEHHNNAQIAGHPNDDQPVVKFLNLWAMKVPRGYSVLFTKPLNRVETRFQPFSGVVDCDEYFNFVNIPALWTAPGYEGVVEKGTPLVQVIPFKRDSMLLEAVVRQMTREESVDRERESARVDSEGGHYISEDWQRKPKTTMTREDDR